MHPFRRLAVDRSGAVTILAAFAMTASLGALAFAVDLGSLYMETRRLQGIADAAALAAANDLTVARTAAEQTVAANGDGDAITADVVTGNYRPDSKIDVTARFDPKTAPASHDAARVTVSTDAELFFGIAAIGRDSVRISRTATAARADLASFSVGSRLLAVEGGIANALLSGLTGSKVSLTAMDYNALLAADVDLFAFSEALQTELDLQAASFDDALSADLTTDQALSALKKALAKAGDPLAAAAIAKLIESVDGDAAMPLDRLIDLGDFGAQDHAGAGQSIRVDAFDLTRAMLELAGGERQVKLDLGSSIPGVADVDVKLAIGDRPANSPWLAITNKGEPVVRTAQTRLLIEAKIGGSGLLSLATLRLPILIELAEAEAKLAAIDCHRNTRSVSLDVRPSIGHASIASVFPADIGNHKSPLVEGPATIVSAPLISVTGKARVDLTAPTWQRVAFDAADIGARRVKTVDSQGLVQGLVGSLVKNMDLKVNVGLFGINAGIITALVGTILTPVAPALDGVVNALTGLLGVHLGQADVQVNGVRCGVPALVA